MENKKIVMLAGKGASTNIVFNALSNRFNVQNIIIESKENNKIFLKRRIKKLGYITVAGQIVFQIMLVPFLQFRSKKLLKKYYIKNNLDTTDIPVEKITKVESVNNPLVAEMLVSIRPDVIVVNGTRIISKKILAAISCPVINMHAGITPKYRGVHGAYWALVNYDAFHCGVTVHIVDAGIDTGDVIYQSKISAGKKDNYITYPVKQLAAGIPILLKAVDDVLFARLKTYKPIGDSLLWYHPTIWEYLYNYFIRKVK